jgi:hypothetical protein
LASGKIESAVILALVAIGWAAWKLAERRGIT